MSAAPYELRQTFGSSYGCHTKAVIISNRYTNQYSNTAKEPINDNHVEKMLKAIPNKTFLIS